MKKKRSIRLISISWTKIWLILFTVSCLVDCQCPAGKKKDGYCGFPKFVCVDPKETCHNSSCCQVDNAGVPMVQPNGQVSQGSPYCPVNTMPDGYCGFPKFVCVDSSTQCYQSTCCKINNVPIGNAPGNAPYSNSVLSPNSQLGVYNNQQPNYNNQQPNQPGVYNQQPYYINKQPYYYNQQPNYAAPGEVGNGGNQPGFRTAYPQPYYNDQQPYYNTQQPYYNNQQSGYRQPNYYPQQQPYYYPQKQQPYYPQQQPYYPSQQQPYYLSNPYFPQQQTPYYYPSASQPYSQQQPYYPGQQAPYYPSQQIPYGYNVLPTYSLYGTSLSTYPYGSGMVGMPSVITTGVNSVPTAIVNGIPMVAVSALTPSTGSVVSSPGTSSFSTTGTGINTGLDTLRTGLGTGVNNGLGTSGTALGTTVNSGLGTTGTQNTGLNGIASSSCADASTDCPSFKTYCNLQAIVEACMATCNMCALATTISLTG